MSPLGYLLTAKRLQIKDLDRGSFVAGTSFFFGVGDFGAFGFCNAFHSTIHKAGIAILKI